MPIEAKAAQIPDISRRVSEMLAHSTGHNPLRSNIITSHLRQSKKIGEKIKMLREICDSDISAGKKRRLVRFGTGKMVGWQGLEPWTNALKGHCSTN